jgi:hypothetical protein
VHGPRVATASFSCASGIAFPGLALADHDGKGPECGLRTLRGAYLFAATGYAIAVAAHCPRRSCSASTATATAPCTFQRRREASTASRRAVFQATVPKLNEDRTGTLQVINGLAFDTAVSPNGNDLRMIQTDQGDVLEGKVTRLR